MGGYSFLRSFKEALMRFTKEMGINYEHANILFEHWVMTFKLKFHNPTLLETIDYQSIIYDKADYLKSLSLFESFSINWQ